MDLAAIEKSPVGNLVPITGTDSRHQHYEHKAFMPDPLPREVALGSHTWAVVVEASNALSRLNQAGTQIPAPAMGRLTRPAIRREAQSTSALEGTHAAFTDLLEADLEGDGGGPRSPALIEVMNYVHVAELGFREIVDRPITLGMISGLQHHLVRGTSGELSDAGRIRDRQVVVGPEGASVRDARYVPPPPGDQLRAGVEEWISWINDDELNVPPVVRAALAHYHFEALHPFSDGNGRLGRLIVVLQLMRDQVLRDPLLIVSPWFEARRRDYQDHLLAVSQTGDFDSWVAFFCEGLRAQAVSTMTRVDELTLYQQTLRETVHAHPIRGVGVRIADDLVGQPIITPPWAAAKYGVSYQAANSAVARLVDAGILEEMTGRSYARIFASRRILNIFDY